MRRQRSVAEAAVGSGCLLRASLVDEGVEDSLDVAAGELDATDVEVGDVLADGGGGSEGGALSSEWLSGESLRGQGGPLLQELRRLRRQQIRELRVELLATQSEEYRPSSLLTCPSALGWDLFGVESAAGESLVGCETEEDVHLLPHATHRPHALYQLSTLQA